MKLEPEVRPDERRRLLIEEWLPIAEIGIESLRERTPMTPFPAPNRLHVWFARRPLVASRAAVLASLLPADTDRAQFTHALGIHGDPIEARRKIDAAVRSGIRVKNPYDWDRAFNYTPTTDDLIGMSRPVSVLDPTAGGGSIPFEANRLGLTTIANDLNPVAWLILMTTVEFPSRFGSVLLTRFVELAQVYYSRLVERIESLYPQIDEQRIDVTYLWARTISCPYCSGKVPLSPMWNLTKTTGVQLVPVIDQERRYCRFEVVDSVKKMSRGTVKGGVAVCPFSDCGQRIDGDHIKEQAQSGQMGQQLHAVVYRETKKVGQTKHGKPKLKKVRGFRAPRPEDDVEAIVAKRLAEKMPEWEARNIVPDERIPEGNKTNESIRYGIPLWREMFSPRQLFGHCSSVEVFQELVAEFEAENGGELKDLDRSALVYVAFAIDKIVNYNSLLSRWDAVRVAIRGKFDRHDFAFQWSYGEMAPTTTGLGYAWAIKQTEKALEELIGLVGSGPQGTLEQAKARSSQILCKSADSLPLENASVDCVVMDPPYYDNVMYAELSDFFYVWLKRTAGLLYPEVFHSVLTDKDHEAVANPARFQGQKGAKALAGVDYQQRMSAIFKECRRVLKREGVMTLMFTHKASGAWDALTKSLVEAGFVITASWPINTEAEGSLHIKDKMAAKSTIFLVCRLRKTESRDIQYWEDVEPRVANAVRRRVKDFQEAGIAGVDLYLACFGPALEVFSEAWPITRGEARPAPKNKRRTDLPIDAGPYGVSPEDALDAARREVMNWRIQQLARVNRQQHLDPLTEWYVLAWDAFHAPRFPADEALKLARVVGLDFDRQVKNVLCEVKGNNVTLWNSKTRKLRNWSGDCLIDTLHSAAHLAQTQNVGAAQQMLEEHGLLNHPGLRTALEALLNVLQPTAVSGKQADTALASAASDFEALEKLRRLAFVEHVPAPVLPQTGMLGFDREIRL
jgi:putative DNA methylase